MKLTFDFNFIKFPSHFVVRAFVVSKNKEKRFSLAFFAWTLLRIVFSKQANQILRSGLRIGFSPIRFETLSNHANSTHLSKQVGIHGSLTFWWKRRWNFTEIGWFYRFKCSTEFVSELVFRIVCSWTVKSYYPWHCVIHDIARKHTLISLKAWKDHLLNHLFELQSFTYFL